MRIASLSLMLAAGLLASQLSAGAKHTANTHKAPRPARAEVYSRIRTATGVRERKVATKEAPKVYRLEKRK